MLRITLLGTASSAGVPRIGPVWGACDPANPKNRRRRCALLVERISANGRTTILVDTPADLREQLIDAQVGSLDGVLFTHDHADHTHGIDDLRGVFFNMRKRVRIWADPATRRALEARFDYCFAQPPGSLYPAILEPNVINAPQPFRIGGAGGSIDVRPYWQHHGDGKTLGFRFGNIAYSPDVSDIPDESLPCLEGLDLWIVDALRATPHPSHFSVKQAREWIHRLKVPRAVLTHMTVDLDYETLRRQLPANIEPGYDGMVLEVPD
jgi:phosphoribosyl 1,2-cyclic phosphate phosphodiesterase